WVEAALGPEGTRGPAAGGGEQGHRRPIPARGARAAPCVVRRRRRHRPGGVPRTGRPRSRRPGRRRLRRGAERARTGCGRDRRRDRRARRAAAAPVTHLTDAVLAPIRARYGEPRILEWEGEISGREYGIATY